MVRITLPYNLRVLAKLPAGELQLEIVAPVTIDAVVSEIERRYPMLMGTIRDHTTRKRRPFIRFFANEEDLSNEPTDVALPENIASGQKPLMIVGAIAGG